MAQERRQRAGHARALTYAGDFDALVVHHTEDPDLTGDGVMNEGEFAARVGLFGIPKAAETGRAGARCPPRRAHSCALPRRRDHLRGVARRPQARKEEGLPVSASGLDQSPRP